MIIKLINRVSLFYQSIRELGITSELKFSDKLRIKSANTFILISLHVITLHVLYNVLGPNEPKAYLVSAAWSLISFGVLFLNHQKRYLLAKICIMGPTLLGIISLHLLNGPGIRLEPMYLLTILVSVFFFRRNTAIGLSLFTGFAYIFVAVYLRSHPAPWADRIIDSAPFAYFFFATICVFLLAGNVLLENANFNQLLQTNNQALARKNKELERFNYILSHDLKTPLRHIISFSGLLDRQVKREEFAEAGESIAFIQEGAARMDGLITDIRSYASIDSVQDAQNREWVDLNELIASIKEKMQVVFADRSIEIQSTTLPTYFCCAEMVEMMLEQLILNGLTYNESELACIDISHRTKGQFLCIDLKDNGIGIEEKYHEYVFEHFRRLPSARNQNSSGIGLSISQKVAELYQGKILLDSAPNSGSTFSIQLPVSSTE
jgi:signal transduction histidine kinase